MPLLLVIGRANAGKTGAAHDAVRRAAHEGRDPVLILPSEPDVARARRELIPQVPLGLRVSTFARHAADTWMSHGDGRTIVTPGARQLLLSKIGEQRERSATPGIEALASQTVELLADGLGIAWRSKVPPAGVTAEGLRRYVLEYQRLLDQYGLVELGEVYSLLSAGARFGGDPLVVHRFTDLTTAQEQFITAAAVDHEVIVTLPWEEGFAPTAALDPLVARLSRLGRTRVCRDDPRGTEAELLRLGSELFGSPTAGATGRAVRFVEVEGEEAEADRIAAEVAEALADGVRPSDIAVVFRDPSLPAAQLKAAFGQLDLAADFDILIPLSRTAFGKAFLQALDFVNTGSVTALLGYTRSAFVALSQADQEHFEREVRSRRTTPGAQLVRKLENHSIHAARLIAVLDGASRKGITPDTAFAIAKAAREMLGSGHAGRDATDDPDLAEDVRTVRALESTLEDALVLLEHPVDTRLFARALGERLIGPGPVERDGYVQVTSVERARARRFDTVILGGLHAGGFPGRADELFVPGGAAGRFLEDYGVESSRSLGAEYERLLLYQVITRPRRRLTLVRRRADSDGALMAPSVFWEELLDFYRPAREEAEPEEGTISIDRMECGMGSHSSPNTRRALREAAICGAGELDPRVASALSRAEVGPALLSDADALTELATRDVFSVSEIEAYLACPLRWFYERVVRPEQLDVEFDGRERGRLAHEMLRAAYSAISSELEDGRVTTANVEQALALAQRTMKEVLAHEPMARDFEEEQERRELLTAASSLIERDAEQLPGGFRPQLLEWEFGGETGIDVGGFALRGRIDRVDTDGERAVVIDYKAGTVPTRAALLGKGRIQAQVYAEVVRRELGLVPVGSVYWPLGGGKPRGLIDVTCLDPGAFTSTDCGDSTQLDAEIQEALDLAASAVKGIRAGDLAPNPREGACEWCTATALCGRSSE